MNSDSVTKSIVSGSSFGGSTIGTFDPSSVSVNDAGVVFADADELFVDFSEVKTTGSVVVDNDGAWSVNKNSSWYSFAGEVMPSKLYVVAKETGVNLIDSSDNTVWMSLKRGAGNVITSAVTAVTSKGGAVFVGTESGVIKLDFENDEIVKFVGQNRYTAGSSTGVYGGFRDVNSGHFFFSDEKVLRQGELVGAWDMDNYSEDGSMVKDSSGNFNDLTIYGDTVFTNDGPSGNAVTLDGVDDYLGSSSDEFNIEGNLAVSTWFKADSYPNTWIPIITNSNEASTSRNYAIFLKDDGTIYYLSADSTDQKAVSSAVGTISLDKWYSVTLIVEDGKLKGYLDGVLISSVEIGVPVSGVSHFQIGGVNEVSASLSNFNGSIDQPIVLSKALSDSEISDLYQVG